MPVVLERPRQVVSPPASESRPLRIPLPSWRVLRWATVTVVCLLYLGSFTPRWWWTPDGALYLMLKDNLLAGKGYALWGFPHIHVPPGFPAFLAVLDCIGLGTEWGRNLVMIGIGLGTIWACYRVLLRVTSEGTALLVTAAFAYCHTMHFNTIRLLSDVPCMFFVWLGLWCWLAGLKEGGRHLELGTLFWLVACSMRVAALPLALGASAGLVLQPRNASRRRTWLNAAAIPALTLLAVVGFAAYRMTLHGSLPTYESDVLRIFEWSFADWFRQPLEHSLQTSWSLSEILMGQPNESLGWVMTLVYIPIAFGMRAHVRRGNAMLVLMSLAYCVPIMILRDMLPRYLLPVAPLVILFFCDGFREIFERIAPVRRWAPAVPLVLAWAAICCNLPKTLGHWPDIHFGEACHRQLEETHREVARFLKENADAEDRFLSSAFRRNLSYRSGVASLPVANRRFADADREFAYWTEQGVRYFLVFDPERCRHRHYMQMYLHTDMMNDDFLHRHGLEIVYQTEGCRIYAPNNAQTALRKDADEKRR